LTFSITAPMLNRMVEYQDASLDRTFAALADPTRRGLLARLHAEPVLSVSQLAQPFAMSLPAVMKHLDVLAEAGLITRRKTGRIVSCRLNAAPMEQAVTWLDRYRRYWTEQLDRLAAFVEHQEETCPQVPQPTPGPALPSPAASRRRRRGSSAPGPTRNS
jgi:DNA-binding transcriptional ArsR family regulator